MRITPPAERGAPIGSERGRGATVDVRDLSWRPFGRKNPVLTGLDLRIEPGERVLLAGPSGCGKSTLLRAIAGVLTTTESGDFSGSVEIDGVASHQGGATVGLLLQDPADATVAARVGRDVAFGPENVGVARERIWPRVRQALAAVGFPYGLEHPVNALSGGQSQRLALAGVLVLGPGLVLLDEPSSMLDPAAAAEVREAIWATAGESGATVVLVEHQLDAWLPELDRVIVLGPDGAITADGPVADTLVAAADALAEQGVWVPGAPVPIPLDVPGGLCAPMGTRRASGDVMIRAEGAGVLRTLPAGLGAREPRGTVTALAEVDAVVRAGEIVALVGPSGAGKSTLAGLLAGLEPPTSGVVAAGEQLSAGLDSTLAGWSSAQLARRVGWVPQQAELAVVGRTVREDVLSTGHRLNLDGSARRAERLMEVLGLAESAEIDPHHLSGGQLRRLALAGAIAHGPALLVLDEPTVGQDRQTWAAVAGIILAARDAGVAVVVATHDPLLMALADRCIRLDRGRVVDDAGPVGSAGEAPKADAPPISAPPGRTGFQPLATRCGPLALLGASVLLLAGGLSITNLGQALLGVSVELLLAPLVIGWRRHGIRGLLPSLLAVASVWFSTWLLSTGQDPVVGATAGLRVAFFVLPGVMLVRFIDPFALGDHLAQRLRLPGRPVVAVVAALQRFETLTEQWGQLRRTRRVRGLEVGRGPVARARQLAALTFALLVQSLRQAGRMAVAMEARGFSSTPVGARRTWAEPAPWLPADTALILLAAVVAVIPVASAVLR